MELMSSVGKKVENVGWYYVDLYDVVLFIKDYVVFGMFIIIFWVYYFEG